MGADSFTLTFSPVPRLQDRLSNIQLTSSNTFRVITVKAGQGPVTPFPHSQDILTATFWAPRVFCLVLQTFIFWPACSGHFSPKQVFLNTRHAIQYCTYHSIHVKRIYSRSAQPKTTLYFQDTYLLALPCHQNRYV